MTNIYVSLIDKLIEKTNNKQQKWDEVKVIPDNFLTEFDSIARCFSTEIKANTKAFISEIVIEPQWPNLPVKKQLIFSIVNNKTEIKRLNDRNIDIEKLEQLISLAGSNATKIEESVIEFLETS